VAVSITGSTTGTVTLSIAVNKVHDVAGNLNAASTSTDNSVSFDNVPPAAPGTPDLQAASDTGTSNSDNITSITTPTFTVSAISGNTVTLFDGSTQIGSAVASGGIATITSSILSEGVHSSITAKQTNSVGNTSAASAALSVTIDTIAPAAPSIPALSPALTDPDGIIAPGTKTFTGTADAGPTVTILDGVTQIGSGTAAQYASPGITTSTISTAGDHSITAKSTDTAGNSSTSGALVLTVSGAISATTIGTQSTNSADNTLAQTATVAVGNTIFVTIATDPVAATFTITDNGSGGSNTYTKDADVTNSSHVRTLIFSAPVTHALSSGTITVNSTAIENIAATFITANGLLSLTPKDQSQTATGNSTTPNSGNTATTSQADELLIGAVGFDERSQSVSAGAGFTNLCALSGGGCASANGGQASGNGVMMQPEYEVVSTTGQYAASWSGANSNKSTQFAAAIVTYKIKFPTLVSIVRNGVVPNPTNNDTTLHFTVTFSEPVFGLDAEDFALVESGVTGSSMTDADVSTSDKITWTVAVHIGTGTGTVGLNYHDDADFTVNSNNIPLNGSGAGVVIVTGPAYTTPDCTAPTGATLTPNSQTLKVGDTLTLSATVTGGTAPYDYVYKQGSTTVATHSNINSTTDSYIKTNIDTTHAGSYTVEVTSHSCSGSGSATSSAASVTVNKRTASIAVSFASNPIMYGGNTTATATVTDTDTGTAIMPTGTVTFSSDSSDNFSSTTCTLAAGVLGTATCSVTVTTTHASSHVISAS